MQFTNNFHLTKIFFFPTYFVSIQKTSTRWLKKITILRYIRQCFYHNIFIRESLLLKQKNMVLSVTKNK